MTEIIEGVSAQSSRTELFAKIRELYGKLTAKQDKKLAELEAIEERVRAKFANRHENLLQIIATSTEQEWHDAIDFLENFEDMLPVGLFRVYDGARTALDRVTETTQAEKGDATP